MTTDEAKAVFGPLAPMLLALFLAGLVAEVVERGRGAHKEGKTPYR